MDNFFVTDTVDLINNDNEDEWAEAQLAGRSLQVIQVHCFNIELTVFT